MSHDPIVLPDRLNTPRLVVRPYSLDDAGKYFAACLRNRTHLVPFERDNPARNISTIEGAEALLRGLAFDWAARGQFFLGAWGRETGEFIAQIYLGVDTGAPSRFEVGYWVDAASEGHGYVTEAAEAVLAYVFSHLNGEYVRISCNELNVRSRRVAERLGFELEEYHPRTHPDLPLADGTPSGDLDFGLTKGSYEDASSRRSTESKV